MKKSSLTLNSTIVILLITMNISLELFFSVKSTLVLKACIGDKISSKLFYNILSDCHYSDIINSLLNANRLQIKLLINFRPPSFCCGFLRKPELYKWIQSTNPFLLTKNRVQHESPMQKIHTIKRWGLPTKLSLCIRIMFYKQLFLSFLKSYQMLSISNLNAS